MESTIIKTDLGEMTRQATGKVRDIYAFEEDKLLLVATDRISAFDVVFPDGIPRKGQVLTQLAAHWFRQTGHIVENHLISADFNELPETVRRFEALRGRVTLCRRAEVLPIECVVRGYLEGSGWKEYQVDQTVGGIKLPAGLERRSRLDHPIFTPATKATSGHDENITFDAMVQRVGGEVAEVARDLSLQLYNFAYGVLEKRGIILADTKLEFGRSEGNLILIDEAFTPDSSRFWVEGSFNERGEPVSYDKQYVRDFLETTDWNKMPPAPSLPPDVIQRTSERYLEIYEKITGASLTV